MSSKETSDSSLQMDPVKMITLKTTRPQALLGSVKAAIAASHVTTWQVDSDGDFTHSPAQWRGQAWLRPSVIPSTSLSLEIIYARGATNTKELYAVYHGRFLEMMLAHFDQNFTAGTASAL